MSDVVVVGAGLTGLTVAERLAAAGRRVLLLEARDGIGGNCASAVDPATGIEVHRYGTHVFHTSDERVWAYVNRFTGFTRYEHRVWTVHRGRVYPMPISLATVNQFFGRAMGPAEARALVAAQAAAEGDAPPTNLEEKAVRSIGRPLYEAFVRGYTAKQWRTDPRDLPASVIARLPVRYSYDTRYFDDVHQGLPVDGYGAWFARMADHPRIEVRTGTDFLAPGHAASRDAVVGRVPVVFTGPVDRYFGHAEGMLCWRTLDLAHRVLPVADHQGTAVLNHADEDVPHTRVHEFRHLHPERRHGDGGTAVAVETSRAAGPDDEPYYPVRTPADLERLARYRERAAAEPDVTFAGRLGGYRYLDMHVAVAAALRVAGDLTGG